MLCQEGPFSPGLGGNSFASFNLLFSRETQCVLSLEQAVSVVLRGCGAGSWQIMEFTGPMSHLLTFAWFNTCWQHVRLQL